VHVGGLTLSKIAFRFEYAIPNNLSLVITPDVLTQLDAINVFVSWVALNIVEYTPDTSSGGVINYMTHYQQCIRYTLNSVPNTYNFPPYTGQRLWGSNLIIEGWSKPGVSTLVFPHPPNSFPNIVIPTSVLGNQDLRYGTDFNFPTPVQNSDWSEPKVAGSFALPFTGQASNSNVIVINTNTL
jgi:hypothetical protein